MFKLEVQGSNTFLVYRIEEKDICDTVTLGMLKNNEIQGLLPFTYSQMDGDIFLKYNVTSKISLAHFLAETVTKKQILTIWQQIIDTFLTLEEYMILQNSVVLDLENIYINVSSLKVEMACLPIMCEEVDIEDFFKSFIYRTHFAQNEDTSYVVRLIEYFNGKNPFSVTRLKELLQSLDEDKIQKTEQKEVSASVVKQAVNIQMIPPVEQNHVQMLSRERAGVSEPPDLNPGFESNYAPPRAVLPSKSEKKGLFGGVKEKKNKKEKKKVERGVKADRQAKSNSTVSTFNFAVPGQQPSIPLVFVGEEKEQTTGNAVTQSAHVQSTFSQTGFSASEGGGGYSLVGGKNFGETTVLNAEIGETTVLSSEIAGSNTHSSKYLIRSKNQQKIPIHKEIFKIGKEASYVDYCISDNSNISRSHADIIVKGEQIYICDNNSTNHTFVNGMMLLPGEQKELHVHDKIRLANEEFVLKIF